MMLYLITNCLLRHKIHFSDLKSKSIWSSKSCSATHGGKVEEEGPNERD